MLIPYLQRFNRSEDFIIKYRYFLTEEGARKQLQNQHIRNDFWYEHPDHTNKQIFTIYPEFLDENGKRILEGEVLREGIVKMWISFPEMFAQHKSRIKI